MPGGRGDPYIPDVARYAATTPSGSRDRFSKRDGPAHGFPNPLPNQNVIIENNTIRRVGPEQDVGIPSRSTVIDGRGKYLLPGLADMHVHLAMPAAPRAWLSHSSSCTGKRRNHRQKYARLPESPRTAGQSGQW